MKSLENLTLYNKDCSQINVTKYYQKVFSAEDSTNIEDNMVYANLFNDMVNIVKDVLQSLSGIQLKGAISRLLNGVEIWVKLDVSTNTGVVNVGKFKRKFNSSFISDLLEGVRAKSLGYKSVILPLNVVYISDITRFPDVNYMFQVSEIPTKESCIIYPPEVGAGMISIKNGYKKLFSQVIDVDMYRFTSDWVELQKSKKEVMSVLNDIYLLSREMQDRGYTGCFMVRESINEEPELKILGDERIYPIDERIYNIIYDMSSLPTFYTIMVDSGIQNIDDVVVMYSTKCSESGSADIWFKRISNPVNTRRVSDPIAEKPSNSIKKQIFLGGSDKMMFVDDLKKNYETLGLPERFVDCLPDSCPDCGFPLVMSETLTGLSCSNPRCKSKLLMRIKAVCKDLNILYFGESTIEKFIDYYEPTSPLDIFELEEGMILGEGVSPEVSNKVISQIKSKNSFLLWELVQVANLPFIRTSARAIFQGYSNLSEAYRDIENGGIDFIQSKLGISKNGELSIQASKIYASLIEFKDDLLEAEKHVNIVSTEGLKELNVVCSDQVGGGFSKKPEFYAYVKEHYGDRVHVNFLTSVNKNIDYLVWAGADGSPARYTSKVQKVEGYNAKGYDIPIVTADQFLEEIESL